MEKERARFKETNRIMIMNDYEDPVEVQEDKEIICYQVLFEDLVNPENYNS